MSENNTTHGVNSPACPPGPRIEDGPSSETPPFAPETFIARGSGDFEIVLPRTLIDEATGKLIDITGTPDFHDAMELVWFKADPENGPAVRELVSMLLTLYRCSRDGNVRPPVDLEALYAEKYREMASGNCHSPGMGAQGE